jgi:hypothetical protein
MNAMFDTYGQHHSVAEQTNNTLWTETGPVGKPSANTTRTASRNTRILGSRRLHFLEFDDVNNRILCGSPTAGLFYSEDGGSTWINGGVDYLDVVGASHAQIAKNTNSGKTWFVITAQSDGFKDYDQVELIHTETEYITSLSPNPAQSEFVLEFILPEESTLAEIRIIQVSSGEEEYSLIVDGAGEITIDVSNYTIGAYEVLLISNNAVLDNETLLKQ